MITVNLLKVKQQKAIRIERAKIKPKITVITESEEEEIQKVTETAKPVIVNQAQADLLTHDLWQEYADIERERNKLSSSIYSTVYGKKSTNHIDIGTVKNKIDTLIDPGSGEVRTFGLRYITEKGISEMTSCRKNVKNPRQQTSTQSGERGKFKYNLQRKGVILLTSPDKSYRSVLVPTIYEFQDFNTSKWIAVRH